MNALIDYRPLQTVDSNQFSREVMDLWEKTLAETFPLIKDLWYRQVMNSIHTDRERSFVAYHEKRAVGFIIVKRCQEPISFGGIQKDHYWLSCVLVDPQFQRLGIGSTLIQCVQATIAPPATISVGSDLDHLFPGIPAENKACRAFFRSQGFIEEGDAYDLRCSIRRYKVQHLLPSNYAIRRLSQNDYSALDRLLRTQFSPRWHYDTLRALESEKPMTSLIGLFHGPKLIGFAHLYRYDQPFYGGSVYWKKLLEEKHGGLGPIGIHQAYRGKGLGKVFFDHAVKTLSLEGVEDMVVDWTILLDFYGQYGFTPWKHYIHSSKRIV